MYIPYLVMSGAPEETERSWGEAMLSNCRLSLSYEDIGEEKGGSNLSSFILVSEDNSAEVIPRSDQDREDLCERVVDDQRLPVVEGKKKKDQFVSSDAFDNQQESLCSPQGQHEERTSPLLGLELPSPPDHAAGKQGKEHTNSCSTAMCLSNNNGLYSPTFPLDGSMKEDMVSMSSSTVFVEQFVTQREARLTKNANRELKLKVSRLTEILDSKRGEIENLQRTVAELQGRCLGMAEQGRRSKLESHSRDEIIANLKMKLSQANDKLTLTQKKHALPENEAKVAKLEAANKKLIADKCGLEEKIKRLSSENRTMFERSSKLLSQIQDSETKRAVEACERQVLMGKVDYLSAELNKMKQWMREAGNQDDCDTVGKIVPKLKQQQQPPKFKSTVNTQVSSQTGKPEVTLSQEAAKLRIRNDGGGVAGRGWSGMGNTEGEIAEGQGRMGNAEGEIAEGQGRMVGGGRSSGGVEDRRERGGRIKEGGDVGGGTRLGGVLDGGGMLKKGGVECPICGKQLQYKESEFSVLMHVEHCIQLSERRQHSDDT